MRPPAVEVVYHELHHRVVFQLFPNGAVKDEGRSPDGEDRDVAIQQLPESQRFIECSALFEIPCRQDRSRGLCAVWNGHFCSSSKRYYKRGVCRTDISPCAKFVTLQSVKPC